MRIAIILDPLHKLNIPWDTTLALAKEFESRGNRIWLNTRFKPKNLKKLQSFDLILIRKEPPFDKNYLKLTYSLETIADQVPIHNHPRGIRNVNEKLSILNFPQLTPETILSSDPERIIEFKKKFKKGIVIKPLNQKWGLGVHRIGNTNLTQIRKSTQNGKKLLMAQEYIPGTEKRITILDGKVLAAYAKIPAKGEFRANLHAGGSYKKTNLTHQEKRIVAGISPYLKNEGIELSGIDVIGEKLLEINVTCPGALIESELLYPRLNLFKKLANFLEKKVKNF